MTDFLKKISSESEGRRKIGAEVVRKQSISQRTPSRSDDLPTAIPIQPVRNGAPRLAGEKAERQKPASAHADGLFRRANDDTEKVRGRSPEIKISRAPLQNILTKNNAVSNHAEALSLPPEVMPRSSHTAFLLHRKTLWTAVCVGVIGVAGGIILTTVFAHLTIAITPSSFTKEIPKTLLTVDTETRAVDVAGRRLPGLKVTVEKTYEGTYPASGKKYVDAYATGTVTITNALSSLPQMLIKNTRFADTNGKIFRITKNITVPGAKIEDGKILPSSIAVDVVADKPGDAYNIGPSDFTIPGFRGTPKYSAFTGKSDSPFTGGFQGEATVATADDIHAGQEQASRELFLELKNVLEKKIPPGDEFVVLDGSRNILITNITGPKAGDAGEKIVMRASGTAEVLVFRKADLFSFLTGFLLSPNESAAILSEKSDIQNKDVRFDSGKGRLVFTVSGTLTAVRTITEDVIKTAAISQSIAAVEQQLRNYKEIGGFQITSFPFWLRHAPANPAAIHITVGTPKTD